MEVWHLGRRRKEDEEGRRSLRLQCGSTTRSARPMVCSGVRGASWRSPGSCRGGSRGPIAGAISHAPCLPRPEWYIFLTTTATEELC